MSELAKTAENLLDSEVVEIDGQIVSFEIVEKEIQEVIPQDISSEYPGALPLEVMGEHIKSPRVLRSTRYKIVPRGAGMDENYYVNISDITLNKGTQFEEIRPFEIFINTKDTSHIQWVNALALVLSAIMRKGGDVAFIVKELQAVVDPSGGWLAPGGKGRPGKYVPSLVSAIGDVLQEHFEAIGLIKTDNHRSELNAQYQEYEATISASKAMKEKKADEVSVVDDSQLGICPNCNFKALKYDGGCPSCLECNFSRCG